MSPNAKFGVTYVLLPVEKWVRPAKKSVCGSIGIITQSFAARFSADNFFKIVFSSCYFSLFSLRPSLLIYFFYLAVLYVRTSSISSQSEVRFKQTHNKVICILLNLQWQAFRCVSFSWLPLHHPTTPAPETLVNLLLSFQISSLYQWSDLIAMIDFQVSWLYTSHELAYDNTRKCQQEACVSDF